MPAEVLGTELPPGTCTYIPYALFSRLPTKVTQAIHIAGSISQLQPCVILVSAIPCLSGCGGAKDMHRVRDHQFISPSVTWGSLGLDFL